MFAIPFLSAAENDTENSQIDKAYDCLKNKTESKCASLSYEEKIFTLLAIDKCESELLTDSMNNATCFPASGCKIKSTAQAILALDNADVSTSKSETWLLSQNKTPLDVVWYLQLDSPGATTCSIKYGGASYSISIGENKKINSAAGSCLTLAQDGYWLEVSQNCYNYEFELSCDAQFITNLLFKKKDATEIYVSGTTNSASAEGTTKEKVNSYCFVQGGSCNYEGSLWSALVLDHLGYDISSYMPYLITMADENSQYIPEAFLYLLTGNSDYRIGLLEKQKSDYWDESGDKFYDTAVALYPFQDEEVQEKTNSQDWLLEIQDSQSCWKGEVGNTAFLLYSIWPRESKDLDEEDEDNVVVKDCEDDADGFCMSSINCEDAGGKKLDDYRASCSGLNVCCDREKSLETCAELNGEKCPLGQTCSTSTVESADISECCLSRCKTSSGSEEEEPECELYGGNCRGECLSSEEESSDDCNSGEICCVAKSTSSEKKNYLWVWIILVLIVLVLIAIVLRNKLRPFWFRLTSKFGKSGPKPPVRPGFPMPLTRPPQRLIPRQHVLEPQRTPMRKPQPKNPSELDEVLKKLKEIGK